MVSNISYTSILFVKDSEQLLLTRNKKWSPPEGLGETKEKALENALSGLKKIGLQFSKTPSYYDSHLNYDVYGIEKENSVANARSHKWVQLYPYMRSIAIGKEENDKLQRIFFKILCKNRFWHLPIEESKDKKVLKLCKGDQTLEFSLKEGRLIFTLLEAQEAAQKMLPELLSSLFNLSCISLSDSLNKESLKNNPDYSYGYILIGFPRTEKELETVLDCVDPQDTHLSFSLETPQPCTNLIEQKLSSSKFNRKFLDPIYKPEKGTSYSEQVFEKLFENVQTHFDKLSNNLKNQELDKKAAQIFEPGASGIALEQGASEGQKYDVKSTQSKTDSSGCFDIEASVTKTQVVSNRSFFFLSIALGVGVAAGLTGVVFFKEKIFQWWGQTHTAVQTQRSL